MRSVILLTALLSWLLPPEKCQAGEPFVVENKTTPTFTVDNKTTVLTNPARERFTAVSGWIYEKGDDGVWRSVSEPKQDVAPVVAAPATFRQTNYHAGHNCPKCGSSQFIVDYFNRDGTHNHRCPADGTIWRH